MRIRKRLGISEFEDMTQFLQVAQEKRKKEERGSKDDEDGDFIKKDDSGKLTHKGTVKLDATAMDAEIKYPTDIDLLDSARKKSEDLIDQLCLMLKIKKPRTYRKRARKDYLTIIKKKVKSRKERRKAIKKQLSYLGRNIKSIDWLLDQNKDLLSKLSHKDQKYMMVIRHLWAQQREMYQTKKQSCSDRIVSIHQPHVRPIVRGKSKGKVEFGAKVGVRIENGYAHVDHLSWDAYNESQDLVTHIENYKLQYGYYPFRVLADKIYLNRVNRAWMKERNIEIVGPALGRPSKESQTPEYKKKMQKAAGERNEVEGFFGVAKRRYGLNDIRARLRATSESWIATGVFTQNLMRFLRGLLWLQIQLFQLFRFLLQKKSQANRFQNFRLA